MARRKNYSFERNQRAKAKAAARAEKKRQATGEVGADSPTG